VPDYTQKPLRRGQKKVTGTADTAFADQILSMTEKPGFPQEAGLFVFLSAVLLRPAAI
jgi:hypothetical protein